MVTKIMRMAIVSINGGEYSERAICHVRCLSTDPKTAAPNGSTLVEMDTDKKYMYDAENKQWREVGALPTAEGSYF